MGVFDRFAEYVASLASRARFFAFCLALILFWAPSFLFLDFEIWQLVIKTVTTINTFLLVALLQNTQTRADQAIQHKLNVVADGLADLMEYVGRDNGLRKDVDELKAAVGLEERESTVSPRTGRCFVPYQGGTIIGSFAL